MAGACQFREAPERRTIGGVEPLLEATFTAEQRHFWFRGFRRFVRPLLARATRGLSHARILDCGCGTGANLRLLREFGEAFGFDLAPAGLRFARRSALGRIARASVVHIPFRNHSVDVVTSFDVIYALEDQDETQALDEMCRVLRPGGRIIVNVAALALLRGNHSVLGEEVRRYTRRRLREALERAGFVIERITYTNISIFPLVAGVRLLQRLGGPPTPEALCREITTPPAPVNALLSALLALEGHALRWTNMPFGSSVLCLARKRG